MTHAHTHIHSADPTCIVVVNKGVTVTRDVVGETVVVKVILGCRRHRDRVILRCYRLQVMVRCGQSVRVMLFNDSANLGVGDNARLDVRVVLEERYLYWVISVG